MTTSILILGIGNLLCADEGFGVHAVRAIGRGWRFPPNVFLVDGGTQGLKLLPHVLAAGKLIVFDAIDCGSPAGSLQILAHEGLPKFFAGKKLSLHQTGFFEVLAVSELMRSRIPELILIGAQPEDVGAFKEEMSEVVREQVEPALEIALGWLREWGIHPEPAETPRCA